MSGESCAEILGEEQIRESDDAVEGCAELVRDVGQEQILGLHRAVELGVELFQPLGRLSHFDGQPACVVVRGPALASDREVRRRLLERRALLRTEGCPRQDAQNPHQLGTATQRHEHEALRHRRG